jgi:hypothetical protein
VGLRAALDRCGKARPTGIRSPDRAARRQSLYRLSYRARNLVLRFINIYYELEINVGIVIVLFPF